ncbi:MAG TPA: BMP family ABC transporter substrate-binding protein [Herpetosiphonaceae bacterium]|nr:BMP family ABC transporter substrate-binding protein [Herpetosiphonaceae bacterium]
MQQLRRFGRPQRYRTFQRGFALALALTLALGVLAACGSPSSVAPTNTAAAPAGSGAVKLDKLKVALIAPNRISDKGYIELAWKGVQDAQKELGAEIKALEVLDNNLVAGNIDDLVSQGYNVIVLANQVLADLAAASAKKYPQVVFIGIDQDHPQAPPNLVGLLFREDQAGYLAGALAALMSKTGKVGAVLGTDVVTPLWLFGEGFRRGALDQNPKIEVTLIYHNDVDIDRSFVDPEWGALQGRRMMDSGIDVIFAAAGATGTGTLRAIAQNASSGAMGIGVDADQYFTVPDAQPILLSSARKEVDKGIMDLLRQAQAGTLKGGTFYGSIGLAPFHDLESKVSPEVKQKLGELQQQLASGQLKVELPPRPNP